MLKFNGQTVWDIVGKNISFFRSNNDFVIKKLSYKRISFNNCQLFKYPKRNTFEVIISLTKLEFLNAFYRISIWEARLPFAKYSSNDNTATDQPLILFCRSKVKI